MPSKMEYPSARALVSTAASVAATAMFVRSFARDLFPTELRHYFGLKFYHFLATLSNEITLVIDEFDGLSRNHLFSAAELYAGTISSPASRTYRAFLPEKEKNIRLTMGGSEQIDDQFGEIKLKWRFVTDESRRRRIPHYADYGGSSSATCELRSVTLTFHKKHKSKVIDEYLPYVVQKSESLKEEKKTLKLLTLKSERMYGPGVHSWHSVNLDHPANFDTLAMDDEMKKMVLDDLDMFVKRKELYRKVGKAWKRGYLLFGPPGTGKSSLIAAMANYLKFDVYDLELTAIRSNSDLRHLLLSTANRSILVVEDIDASIDLSERKVTKGAVKVAPLPPMYSYYPQPQTQQQVPKVTLSGLLNFIDGLWSSIGDERIIIFTTNHKEKLDPALLRPGRMDVHIKMSYCTPCGFRLLASNYLGVTEHPLVEKAEELIGSSKITPAEVGEQLLKSEDPEVALRGLIKFLGLRKEEREREEECEDVQEVELDAEEWKLKMMSKSKSSSDGLREVMKMAKESSSSAAAAEMGERIVRKDEVANALEILFGFLQQEIGNDSVLNLGGLRANVQESVTEGGMRLK